MHDQPRQTRGAASGQHRPWRLAPLRWLAAGAALLSASCSQQGVLNPQGPVAGRSG